MSSLDHIIESYKNKKIRYYELAEKKARDEILVEHGEVLNQILDGMVCPICFTQKSGNYCDKCGRKF